MPARASPGRSGSRASASCSGSAPVARPAADAGAGRRVQPDRGVLLARWRWSPSAAPMRCWPMSPRQAVETYRLAAARRDARRPRHGRDHARPADHGRPVRRLHGRLPRSRALCRRCSPARSAACSPPGSPSCPASCGSSLGAPFVETLRGNKALSAALAAITAAVVGVILNLAVWFALHTLFARGARRSTRSAWPWTCRSRPASTCRPWS